MTLTRMVSLTALMLSVAGCATIETPTRASSLDVAGLTPAVTVAQRSYALQDVQVIMPASLRISEGAGYYPNADVVWRGDPIGDRAQQITAMFETAGDRVSAGLTGDVPVIAVVTLLRFHGLTERTRYSVGGVYSIEFTLEIRNAQTGVVIETARVVKHDLPGPGGLAAVALEQAGQTEKVRVTDHLTYVLQLELTGATSS